MAKKIYNTRLVCDVQIEIDDAVIEAGQSEDFKKVFGAKMKPQDVANHIAYNILVNSARLSQLDGWADLPDDNVRIIRDVWDFEEL